MFQAPYEAVNTLVHREFLFADEFAVCIMDRHFHFHRVVPVLFTRIFLTAFILIAGSRTFFFARGLRPFVDAALTLYILVRVGQIVSACHKGQHDSVRFVLSPEFT